MFLLLLQHSWWMKEGLKKRLLCHILQILEQFQTGLRWMARRTCGRIDIVGCWLQRISGTCSWLLVMPGETGCWLLLTQSSALCRIGSSPTTPSVLSWIRQAHDYEIRCLHHCLLPWGQNKDTDRDRNCPAVAKAAQPPPVGRLLSFGFHRAILSVFCVCVCLADQGWGHRKAQSLAVLLPIWLLGDLS